MTETDQPAAAMSLPDLGILQPTFEAIRTNCHISDARHAGDYTLCVYLLKMREYYRWENNLPLTAQLSHQEITSWVTRREAHWETLENRTFERVPLPGGSHDPFDADAINAVLNGHGLAYSSG